MDITINGEPKEIAALIVEVSTQLFSEFFLTSYKVELDENVIAANAQKAINGILAKEKDK